MLIIILLKKYLIIQIFILDNLYHMPIKFLIIMESFQ